MNMTHKEQIDETVMDEMNHTLARGLMASGAMTTLSHLTVTHDSLTLEDLRTLVNQAVNGLYRPRERFYPIEHICDEVAHKVRQLVEDSYERIES